MFAYLDNSSTTKPDPAVLETMMDAMQNHYGNPSALHKMGLAAESDIKMVKKSILSTLNANEGDLIFTSGGTEANNLAILGACRRVAKRKNHIITSKTEHKSVLETFKQLEKEGFTVTWLGVNALGQIDPQQCLDAVTEQTALISLMMVNNETGIVQPIDIVSRGLKGLKQAPLLHVDAVQAYGKMRLDLKKLNVDLLSMSGHKINGPKGIGALYVKKGVLLQPMIYGGGQQQDIRPGTENTYAIKGLGRAVSLTFENGPTDWARMDALRLRLKERISEALPEVVWNTTEIAQTAPHILHGSFPDVRGEVLLHELESKQVYVSIGSSCNSKSKKYSHVLEAMRLPVVLKEGAVRFSLSRETTEAEIDYAADVVIEAYKGLKAIIKGR